MKGRFSIVRPAAIAALVLLLASAGCRRSIAPTNAASPTTATAVHPTVASLAPSATSIVEGLGLSDHLVAVSAFDRARGNGANLPSAGDSESTDWELLGTLHPDKILIQSSPDRIPAGFRDRTGGLGITIVDCWPLDRLSDVYARITDIAAALGESTSADALNKSIRSRLDALARKSAARPHVSVLLVVDDSEVMVAGPGTFLNDLLQAAGGVNAAPPSRELFFTLDPETLMSLKPDVVLLLLPSASPAAVDLAKKNFQRYTNMPAVVHNHVIGMTDPDLLIPGPRVADIAESFAAVLDAAAPTTTETHP
jgi:iron complex transport system substrate-binding protein